MQEYRTLDKVWVHQGNEIYPGIVMAHVGEAYDVLKFDQTIWRRIVCKPEEISQRTRNFDEFMFNVRKRFMNVPIKFNLPQAA